MTAATAISSNPSAIAPLTSTFLPDPSAVSNKSGVMPNGDASGKSVLFANNLPRPSPSSLVNRWKNSISPYVPSRSRPAPLPGALGTVITAPNLGGNRTSAASRVFSPGSQMINTQGVPRLTSQPSQSALNVFNNSFTQERLSQFATLDPSQKMLARTMLGAAMQGLNEGTLAPKDFSEVVGRILQASQKATFAEPTPVTTGTIGKNKNPSSGEIVPTPAKRPGAIATNEVVPTPDKRPGNNTPAAKTTATPTATAAYPSTGPNDKAPSWWAQATNDPKDPNMGAKLVKLITDSREFARQAQTINVDQVVDPSKSNKTPMQEWKEWSAA